MPGGCSDDLRQKGSVTPFSHEVLRLRPRAGVLSRHGSLPRAYADQCIHAGRSFFFPSKGFFSAEAEQQQTAADSSSGKTADGSSHSEAGGGAKKRGGRSRYVGFPDPRRNRRRIRVLHLSSDFILFCTSLPQNKGGQGGVGARSSSSKNPQPPQQQQRVPGKRDKYR